LSKRIEPEGPQTENDHADVKTRVPALITFAKAKPEHGSYRNWCAKCGYHTTEKPKPFHCPKCGGFWWTTHKGYEYTAALRKEVESKKVVEP